MWYFWNVPAVVWVALGATAVVVILLAVLH